MLLQMKGAEPLQREMLALWKKLKTSKPNATEVNDKLNKLRIKLTRPEAVICASACVCSGAERKKKKKKKKKKRKTSKDKALMTVFYPRTLSRGTTTVRS